MNATVSIGRNVNGTPVDAYAWRKIQRETRARLAALGTVFYSGAGRGDGAWGREDAYTVVLEATPADVRRVAADLAWVFHQDAVAVTFGTVEFIAADGAAAV